MFYRWHNMPPGVRTFFDVAIILFIIFLNIDMRDKSFYQAIGSSHKKFLRTEFYIESEYEERIMDDWEKKQLVVLLDDYKIRKIKYEEKEKITEKTEKCPEVHNQIMYFKIYENEMQIGHIDKDTSYYKVLEGKENFGKIKAILTD